MSDRSDRPTILYIHPSDELFGADRCLLEMVRGLRSESRAIVVLPRDVDYDGRLSRELADLNIDIRRVDYAVLRRKQLRPSNLPRLLKRATFGSLALSRLVREVDAQLVQTNTLAAIAGPIAARLSRRPHVWHVHEMIGDERLVIRLAFRMLALGAGRLVANSNATAQALIGPLRFLRSRTVVAYPGIAAIGDHHRRPTSGTVRVGFVGRLSSRKGVAELLEAIALLRRDGVDVSLEIFGEPPPGEAWREGQLRRRAVGLGIEDRVHFGGFVADVRGRLSEIDVLVVPSQRPEPFGLAILEGMDAGCAVVVSRNGGGSDEIVKHGMTGLYCGRSAASIARAIKRLAVDPLLRERMGERAMEDVRRRFGPDSYVDAIRDVVAVELGSKHGD